MYLFSLGRYHFMFPLWSEWFRRGELQQHSLSRWDWVGSSIPIGVAGRRVLRRLDILFSLLLVLSMCQFWDFCSWRHSSLSLYSCLNLSFWLILWLSGQYLPAEFGKLCREIDGGRGGSWYFFPFHPALGASLLGLQLLPERLSIVSALTFSLCSLAMVGWKFSCCHSSLASG